MDIEGYEDREHKGWKDEYLLYRHSGGEMMFTEWFEWWYKQQEEYEQKSQESTTPE